MDKHVFPNSDKNLNFNDAVYLHNNCMVITA